MNNDGIHSLIDAQVISGSAVPAQGARRATEVGAAGAAHAPDPEVVATAKRRQFPVSEKRRIVAAADACKKPGELGALLRREGVYSSMLSRWRKQIARARDGTGVAASRPQGRSGSPGEAVHREARA